MGILFLLKFAVFDILAWPLLALGYPLCASIRAIEADSNSDIRKLITYWVLFSLISLFDHTFARLLEWLSFWPYVKLMVIFLLVVPHFDGSFYLYENLVHSCFSVDPRVLLERCNKRKDELFLKRENFLDVAERYLKENGPEALERLIASKCTKPNVDEKEIKAVAATEKKEVDHLNCKEPNVAHKDIKAAEVTEKKDVATEKLLKCKEPNVAQKEIKVVEATEKKEVDAAKWVNQTVPNLGQTENQTFTAAGTEEMVKTAAATAGSDSKLPEIPDSMKVQKEWTCALCQVTTSSETNLNDHLQGQRHKVASEELQAKIRATKNKGTPASTGKQEEKVEGLGKQKEWYCALCQVKAQSKTTWNDHLQGQRHKAACEELKEKNQAAKKNDFSASTGKQKEWYCSICQVTAESETTWNDHLQGQRHKTACEELKAKKRAAKNEGSPASTGKQEEKVEGLGKQKEWYCALCQVKAQSKTTWNDHLQGQRHKAAREEQKAKNQAAKQSKLWCYICNVRCPGEIDMVSHFNGRRHLDRIQELTGLSGGGLV